MMDWDGVQVFLAVARAKGIRSAAAGLGLSHSTVSRRLESFESRLGVRLFDRLPEGYGLTDAGEHMLPAAERIEAEFLHIERRLAGLDRHPSGLIRFTLPPVLVTHLAMDLLREFTQAYSGIRIEVVPTHEIVDLDRRDADVAIRFTDAPPGHLVGRRLPPFNYAVYGLKKRIRRYDPAAACWIVWREQDGFVRKVTRGEHVSTAAAVTVPDVAAQVAAVRAGIGIAMLPCFVADRERDLARLPPGRIYAATDAWLLTHPELRTTERVRVFVRFVADALEHRAPELAGLPLQGSE